MNGAGTYSGPNRKEIEKMGDPPTVFLPKSFGGEARVQSSDGLSSLRMKYVIKYQ
jgi:hypothetical protein